MFLILTLGVLYILGKGVRFPESTPKEREELARVLAQPAEHPSQAQGDLAISQAEAFLKGKGLPFLREGGVYRLLPRAMLASRGNALLQDLPHGQGAREEGGAILFPDGSRVGEPPRGWLVLVMDDLGYRTSVIESLSGLGIPLIFSVLPGTPHAQEIARSIREQGGALFLHQPMEPEGYPGVDPGPYALLLTDPPERWQAILEENLKSLPGVVGVNNHMGSRFTAHESAMRFLLSFLKGKDLLFLDSYTTPRSSGPRVCKALHVPCLYRDIFLDHTLGDQDLKRQVELWAKLGEEKGVAIAIAHPHRKTLELLRRVVPELQGKGFRFVGVKELRFWLQYEAEERNKVAHP